MSTRIGLGLIALVVASVSTPSAARAADTVKVAIGQIDARYIEPGQPAEVTFKFRPGQVYSGKVESILQAIASGQVQTSGTAVTPKADVSPPFVVRIRLDDPKVAFRDVDVALLVGARPRSKGMERKDLLEANAQIFTVQGRALDCGHFIPEERPDDVAEEIAAFLG